MASGNRVTAYRDLDFRSEIALPKGQMVSRVFVSDTLILVTAEGEVNQVCEQEVGQQSVYVESFAF